MIDDRFQDTYCCGSDCSRFGLGRLQYWSSSDRTATTRHKTVQRESKLSGMDMSNIFMSMSQAFYVVLYCLICAGVVSGLQHESSPQPIGLLVVAIVFIPLILQVIAGLRLDILHWTSKS